MNELDRGAPASRPRRRLVAAIARPKALHETVVERLRDMIVEGELASGERLHDSNLATILQVSRMPVREAIKLLATEGLVDLLPGRGARVRELSIEDILDLFEAIAGLSAMPANWPPNA
jgi:DNA-binding GntR family transcriptional regulator